MHGFFCLLASLMSRLQFSKTSPLWVPFFYLPSVLLHVLPPVNQYINFTFVFHHMLRLLCFVGTRTHSLTSSTQMLQKFQLPAQHTGPKRQHGVIFMQTNDWSPLLERDWTELYFETGETKTYPRLCLFPRPHRHTPSAIEAVNAAQKV